MCRCSALLVSVLFAALSAQAAEKYPSFVDENLTLGRTVWLANCETCHAYGVAGAPLASDAAAWQPRRAKGVDVLYQHALDGFFGPAGTMMPPRGGNDALADDEVKAAVDYMLRLSQPEQ